MLKFISDLLTEYGVPKGSIEIYSYIIAVTSVLLISLLINIIMKGPVLKLVRSLVHLSKTKWDNIFLARRIFYKLTHLVPIIVLYIFLPVALAGMPEAVSLVEGILSIILIIQSMIVVNAILNFALDMYSEFDISARIPLKGIVQVIKIILYIVCAVLIVSVAINKSPLVLLSTLGALTAVLLLIFKDVILGFVASIQLSANKMVAYRDWIEMPKYGADGEVIDISLTTVKVENFDKTITTIPTYALISESFRNWRGMQESDGRRIKRAIMINKHTIKFCDHDMLQRFRRINYIAEYIDQKLEEIEYVPEDDSKYENINKPRLTNVGTLRAYLIEYLKHHPKVNQEMTLMVRQLAPTENGLPLEIYVFSKDKVWEHYESLQSDIFDHVLAIVPKFDLEVFQNPSGTDFRLMTKNYS